MFFLPIGQEKQEMTLIMAAHKQSPDTENRQPL